MISSIDPLTIILAVVVFFLIYVAFKVLKVAVRTFFLGIIAGLTYVGLVYLEFIQYSSNMLLGSIIVTMVLYLSYKLIQVPLWVLKKIKRLFFGKKR